jgi:hypothetical protein
MAANVTASPLEELFGQQLIALDLRPGCVLHPAREYVFARPRRWRFDFAWPERFVAVEVEGGTGIYGRHNRPAGFERDCEKYAEAAIRGWCVIRATGRMVKDGRAIDLTRRALIAAGVAEEAAA